MGREAPRVLVVEDDPASTELLCELLADDGYDVEHAADGAAAWERLAGGGPPFDALLFDWMLPHLDGMELLARVKATPALESAPVIFQTARSDGDSMMAAFGAGAAYFVAKPVDRALLRAVVAAAVSDHARRRLLQESLRRGAAAASTLVSGRFRYRTCDEAAGLATLLSRVFPDPDRTVMGLSELLVNAVEHGNLGITYEEKSALLADRRWNEEVERRLASPEHRDKRVEVELEREPERVVVTITDRGRGFDWQRYMTVSRERMFDAHGRGIAMANGMSFDGLRYVAPGNRVTAWVDVEETAAPLPPTAS